LLGLDLAGRDGAEVLEKRWPGSQNKAGGRGLESAETSGLKCSRNLLFHGGFQFEAQRS